MSTSLSYRDGGQNYLPAYYLAYALDDEGAAGRVVEPGRRDFLVFGRVVPALERRFVRRERLRRNRRDDAAGGGVFPPVLAALARRQEQYGYALGRIVSMPASLGYDHEVAGPKVAQRLALRFAHRQTCRASENVEQLVAGRVQLPRRTALEAEKKTLTMSRIVVKKTQNEIVTYNIFNPSLNGPGAQFLCLSV